ncbi:MAG TPA: YtxH domain-containing protein [Longimicrobiaceae bacterium]|nr:YtxH domain-containing protein [Longimicrobiaceae bacterium]
MRDHDDVPYIVIERRSAGLGPFVWGALLGAGAALLLAPRSGAETQEEIRQGVRRARQAAEDRVDAVRGTVDRTRTRLEDQLGTVRDQITNVRSEIETRADQARDSFDHAKRTARDTRAEIERRVADVKGTVSGRGDTAAAPPPSAESEVGVTDVSEERAEGRSDLG